jgi:hypothetical protein
MRKLAVFSSAALIGVGALTSTPTQARDGGAFAAGMVGGFAAGAMIGASTNAYARPVYYARPYRRHVIVEDCRVIVKRRYTAYGDVVVRRIRVCN